MEQQKQPPPPLTPKLPEPKPADLSSFLSCRTLPPPTTNTKQPPLPLPSLIPMLPFEVSNRQNASLPLALGSLPPAVVAPQPFQPFQPSDSDSDSLYVVQRSLQLALKNTKATQQPTLNANTNTQSAARLLPDLFPGIASAFVSSAAAPAFFAASPVVVPIDRQIHSTPFPINRNKGTMDSSPLRNDNEAGLRSLSRAASLSPSTALLDPFDRPMEIAEGLQSSQGSGKSEEAEATEVLDRIRRISREPVG